MSRTDCPSVEAISDFVLGKLSIAELGTVAEHLDICAECEQRAAQLDGLVDAVVSGLKRIPGPGLGALDAVAGMAPAQLPERIGRYRIERVLGQGGFGLVYLARDDQLSRPVAIKVPHRALVNHVEDAEAYLAEAHTVANLDHAHIVPVFDVGSTEQFACFIVSKYIDGTDLATSLKQARFSIRETVDLVATVAEALHHAHKQGLVHRDIKSGNILLDKSRKPFVADFGLALREQDVGKGPRYAGTPAYMSPEQARGEGHRVDGRSDIFSLGVVFYELLVGRQPFRGETAAEVMEQVANLEPRPPRQHDDHIPKELERICLKALSKRASERYSTAIDMADDLRLFLVEQAVSQRSPSAMGLAAPSITPVSHPRSAAPASGKSGARSIAGATPTSNQEPIKIIPKGLRSFDAHDADFFLELLPGPRDRDGLPESLRFWKNHTEEPDADRTFTVGLIYGPSGCGKSSLVKAGLLPRLSAHVIAVYVEATAQETETRLLASLRKRCPALPENLTLKQTLAALRRGQGIPVGTKVLIVIDQFEQWLHAKKDEQNTELVQALRQCDGGRVQCIVMVRDDFWMAVTRFLREIEIRLVESRNSAAVDLFDRNHAKKVLAAFGRAFGKLPDRPGDTTKEQKEFLKQAVSGLAQDGKVICVRLALFAEMMKSKTWTPAMLKEVGGTEGVGVAFLEETLGAVTAPFGHRYHQRAARGLLKALLPDSGTDIKGHMRSHAELLEASGYGNDLGEFDDLIRILDGEIRLITPTDPEGVAGGGWRGVGENTGVAGGNTGTSGETTDEGAALPAVGGLAVRHGAGGEVLSGDQGFPEGGDVWTDKPNPQVGGVDPGKHRRGPGKGTHQGVPQPFEHGTGVADGAGNTPDIEPAGHVAATGGAPELADADRPGEPNAQWPAQVAGKTPGGWRATRVTRGGWWVAGTELTLPSAPRPRPAKPSFSPATHHPPPATRCYQLTHDYLVPSLREWLTRKQRESRRGRAQLRLAERSSFWNGKPENRHLPSVWEWANIRLLTKRKNWTEPERGMMKQAGRLHVLRSLGLGLLVTLVTWGGIEGYGTERASSLVASLKTASTVEVEPIIEQLLRYRRWAKPRLVRLLGESAKTSRDHLHASLALLAVDHSQTGYLYDRLLSADPLELPVIWKLMRKNHQSPVDRLWNVLNDPKNDPDQRFRAACALANVAADHNMQRWHSGSSFVSDRLLASVMKDPGHYRSLIETLRPIRDRLVAPLSQTFRNQGKLESERSLAANILSDYAADRPDVLADLLMDATPRQFATLLPTVEAVRSQALTVLESELKQKPVPKAKEGDRNRAVQRQARAAVALVRLGRTDDVWTLLRHSGDPQLRSFIVNWLALLGADPRVLVAELDRPSHATQVFSRSPQKQMDAILFHPETSMRRALILALGAYEVDMLSSGEREPLIGKLLDLYKSDPDAGIHGAAEWTLRQWKNTRKLKEIDDELSKIKDRGGRRWYVNSMGQTFTVIDGPVEFVMGSPPTEPDRFDTEMQHRVLIPRRFAIAAKEVTKEQWQAFEKQYPQRAIDAPDVRRYSPDEGGPMIGFSWFIAAHFCNWLSEQEGLPKTEWCYPPTANGKYMIGMTIPADVLRRKGYRMPTEAEWEYACRSGTTTSRYYGFSLDLFGGYARYLFNSEDHVWVCGSLRPNDLGLFDMLGNVQEWVQDEDQKYKVDKTQATWDYIIHKSIVDSSLRRVRGGAFFYRFAYIRTANRIADAPGDRSMASGFRPARTLP